MKKKTNNRMKKLEPYMYIIPALVLIIIFIGVPMIIGIKTSFYHYKLNEIEQYFCGFENYINVIKNKIFLIALKNSFWWVAISLVFQVILGVTLALCLNKPFKGRAIYQAVVLAPWAVSGFLIGLIWKWLLNGQYGLVNDIFMKLHIIKEPIAFLSTEGLALVSTIIANVWYGIPFFAIMTLAALQSIPAEVYEAGSIDGASSVQTLFNITLPYIKPTLLVTILLRVIWIFNFADIIYTITNGGPANSSQILSTFIIFKAYTGLDFGQASALGVIFMLILLVYVAFYTVMTKFDKAGDF
ncbi:sugar ABC transporter permease [Clostridium sediminicola]|uniref:carbohydrate ABC transporter permease n=1 Tax=Clostridium sediminicola TaxID=3114879 RepID=UPI0031F20799